MALIFEDSISGNNLNWTTDNGIQESPIATVTAARPANNNAAAIEARAQQLAQQMLDERLRALRQASSGKVFSRFDEVNDIVENQKNIVTAGVWSNGSGSLTTFHTSSALTTAQKAYYYEVRNAANADDASLPQFSIAYGHRLGSGSYSGGGQLNDAPSRAIYSQYRNVLLEPGDTQFTLGDNTSVDQIYAIAFSRARLKEKLDPGNWQLNLAQLNGDSQLNQNFTGSSVAVSSSNDTISLIDDSGDADQSVSTVGGSGRIHNIVSGNIDTGIYLDAGGNIHYYGLSYPDTGTLILSADALDASASFNSVTASDTAGDNSYKLFTAVSGAAVINNVSLGFAARNSETVTSTYYFVRAKNSDYNFSNNPTYTTGSVGQLKQGTFVGASKTYITTVGLYNDRQELLAVAKLSKPLLKSFENEYVVKVKLDF